MKHLALNLALAIFLILAPIKSILITVMALTVVDLLSGVWASNRKGSQITSNGLKRTVIKTLVYEIAIILGYIVETYLTGSLVPVTKILSGYIGIVELKSVLENIELITGLPVVASLISKLTQATDRNDNGNEPKP